MAKIIQLLCTDEPHLQARIPNAHVITYARNAADVDVTSIPASHRGEIDYLVMSGSHGNFKGGEPTQLNGLNAEGAEELAGKLMSLGVKAWSVVLDCCFSAGFLPVYKSLLVTGRVKPATMLAHYGSASGTMTGQLGSSMYTVQRAALSKLEDLAGLFDFVSLGVFVNDPTKPRFYVKDVANMQEASGNYIGLISGGGSEATDVNALITYLQKNGIEVRRESKAVVSTVMTNAIAA